MSIPGRVEAVAKGLAFWAGLGIVVLGTLLAGLGFLVAGLFIWIESYKPRDISAAITGGVLLASAIFIGIVGSLILKKVKKRHPPLMSEFTGIVVTAGRIAGLLIRKDPRKSMIIAVIAGAVAEYITSGDKTRK